jgi:hypothetical protein
MPHIVRTVRNVAKGIVYAEQVRSAAVLTYAHATGWQTVSCAVWSLYSNLSTTCCATPYNSIRIKEGIAMTGQRIGYLGGSVTMSGAAGDELLKP